MPAAYVETDFAWVRLRGERLAVFSPKDEDPSDDLLMEIPLVDLERLCVREHVQLTTEALCELLRRGIPVAYVDWKGDCLGLSLPPPGDDALTRQRQYQRAAEPDFALALTRTVLTAKLHNQVRLLQRLDAARPRLPEGALAPVQSMLARVPAAPDLDTARGCEGAAAAAYYPLWAQFLPAAFPFERRSARPPHNPVNACLSYAATLIYRDLVALLHLRGLDPGPGALHVTEAGRWSLALDLMEPFRPALAEALTLRLFSHQVLQAGDFEPARGGIYLTAGGRRTLIEHYERRLAREFYSEALGRRTTLRQALTDAVLSYKAALADPAAFTAFRLN